MVTIQYKTKIDYCNCCGQKLIGAKISKNREFEFTKDDAIKWGGLEWKETIEDRNYLTQLVDEFVHETINFHATNSDEKIIIEKNELKKVEKMILDEVINNE